MESRPKPPGSRQRTRMPREERREQLLKTAETIVLRDGVRSLTMERIANEAGIAKTVVYSHFDNATAVILEILKRHWKHLDEQAAEAIGEASSPLADYLQEYASFYLGPATPERLLLRRLLRSSRQDEEAARVIEGRQLARKKVLARRIRADFDLDESLSLTLATMVLGALGALGAETWRSEDRKRVIEAFVRCAMASMRELSPATRAASGEP